MSKKGKKVKKGLKSLLKGNKILFAALGGAAAAFTLAGIFGTEKGQEILRTVEDSIAKTADRISNGNFKMQKSEIPQGT